MFSAEGVRAVSPVTTLLAAWVQVAQTDCPWDVVYVECEHYHMNDETELTVSVRPDGKIFAATHKVNWQPMDETAEDACKRLAELLRGIVDYPVLS